MRPLRICLDAGHGGQDSGASRAPFVEKELALGIVREMKLLLKDTKATSILTREYDVFIPLSERVRIANVEKCDVFASIHLNADPDPDGPLDREATGFEVWYHPKSLEGKALAEELCQRLSTCLPKTRGIRASDKLYVLKHTKMPAVLVEVGFVDSRHDATLLSEPAVQRLVAQELVLGLLQWWTYQQGI
jgi:N-acetylmuramoyl-L-alanine amidase